MRILARSLPFVVASLAACGGGSYNPTSPNPPSGSASVAASGSANAFSPSPVRVLAGGTVTWSFAGRAHNVTFDARAGAPADVPTTTTGSVTRSFAVAGTFPYRCTVHPGMQGSVIVQ